MDRQEPVQVSFQLPPGSLDGFSRLVEQLRLLAAQLNSSSGRPAPTAPSAQEGMENPAFDWQRYYELGQGAPPPGSVQASCGEGAPAPPEAVGNILPRENGREAEPPGGAEGHTLLEAQAVWDGADSPVADAPQARVIPEKPLPDAPQAQPLLETPLAEAPAVRMEPVSSIPEAEAVWAEMAERAPGPAAVHAEAQTVVELPENAGLSMGAGPADIQSRWGGITEELAAAGPAPLTAEAVSQAFQRDGRRYDNGFPLY